MGTQLKENTKEIWGNKTEHNAHEMKTKKIKKEVTTETETRQDTGKVTKSKTTKLKAESSSKT